MRGLEIIEQKLADDWTSLAIVGEIDLATVDELTKAIKQVQSAHGVNLLVDLTGTAFMDSTGLKTLVVANREFDDAGREFAVAIQPGPIERLIELSGVDSKMRIVRGVDDLFGES